MLSQQASPTWHPRAKACSKRVLGGVDVAEDEVELAAKRLRPGDERRHASRVGLVQRLVEDVERVLDLAAQEVEAAEHGERLATAGRSSRWTARRPSGGARRPPHSRRCRACTAPRIRSTHASSSSRPPASSAVVQRLLRTVVLRAEELNPADLAPAGRGDVARPTSSASVVPSCSAAAPSSSVPRAAWTSAPPSARAPRERLRSSILRAAATAPRSRSRPASTAPAASAASPASIWASTAAPPDDGGDRDDRGSAAARSAGLGSMPRSRRKSSLHAATRRAAPLRHRRAEAADEENVGVLLERVEPDELEGVACRGVGSRGRTA